MGIWIRGRFTAGKDTKLVCAQTIREWFYENRNINKNKCLLNTKKHEKDDKTIKNTYFTAYQGDFVQKKRLFFVAFL